VGRALDYADGVTVSPDGKHVYVASAESDAVAIFTRNATAGALTQATGPAGCVSQDGSGGACVDARGLDGATNVAVSPDGTSVYVVSSWSDAVAIFDRDTTTGALTQKAGTAGCVNGNGDDGCFDGRGFGGTGVQDVIVSPDGNHVYVGGHGGLSTFDRAAGGGLTQKAGVAGCIGGTVVEDGCMPGRGVFAESVTVSLEGKNLYTASEAGDGEWLALLDRNPAGTLTQDAGTAGCFGDPSNGGSGTCTTYREGDFFGYASAVTVSPDGKNVYANTGYNSSIVIFDRDADGNLTPKAGPTGCVSSIASDCGTARSLVGTSSMKVSPDGRTVYATNNWSENQVEVFDRVTATGTLSQDPGATGCVSTNGNGENCIAGKGIDSAQSVALSLDGKNVYVAASGSDAVAVFAREAIPPSPQIGYPRPKGASPLRVPLVVAYKQCTAANRQHGAPLLGGSCNPPAQESDWLTVGTPDANSRAANSSGAVTLDSQVGDTGTPADEADVQLTASITDVRQKSDLADYTGQLQTRVALRLTDRRNGPAFTESATAETTFTFDIPCTATGSTAIGSTCSATTSADAILPGAVLEGKRAIWDLGKVQVFDGGSDGVASTGPNTLFAAQGIFIP
jgi:DNA-binding beta-propeller fold protein YncE